MPFHFFLPFLSSSLLLLLSQNNIQVAMKRPLLVLVCFIISFSNAFLVPAYERGSSFGVVLDRHTGPPKLQMLPDTGSLLTAVEVFDGSSIVDPVVVSSK